jgi:hypothetical protein
LDFVHCLNYNIIKLQSFGNWFLLLSSGKSGEEDTEPIFWVPWFSVFLHLLPADGNRNQLLKYYNSEAGQSKK